MGDRQATAPEAYAADLAAFTGRTPSSSSLPSQAHAAFQVRAQGKAVEVEGPGGRLTRVAPSLSAQRVRALLRDLGQRTDVPIEPDAQMRLLDRMNALPGVLLAGVPGGTARRVCRPGRAQG